MVILNTIDNQSPVQVKKQECNYSFAVQVYAFLDIHIGYNLSKK